VQLLYEEIGDSSINFTVPFWTDPDQQTYLTARSQAIEAIKQTFWPRSYDTFPHPDF
jgi:small-conductance mechanosensitive channel